MKIFVLLVQFWDGKKKKKKTHGDEGSVHKMRFGTNFWIFEKIAQETAEKVQICLENDFYSPRYLRQISVFPLSQVTLTFFQRFLSEILVFFINLLGKQYKNAGKKQNSL